MCQMSVWPAQNPLRLYSYAAKMKHFQLPIEERQLQLKFMEFTHGGVRYIMAIFGKVF